MQAPVVFRRELTHLSVSENWTKDQDVAPGISVKNPAFSAGFHHFLLAITVKAAFHL
jgi:hypothetical protein